MCNLSLTSLRLSKDLPLELIRKTMLSLMGMMMVMSMRSVITTSSLVRSSSSSSSSSFLLSLVTAAASRRNVTLVTGAATTGVVVLRVLGVADGDVGDDVLVGAAVGFDACVAYVCCACFEGVMLATAVMMVMLAEMGKDGGEFALGSAG